jgi:hypothetical protein
VNKAKAKAKAKAKSEGAGILYYGQVLMQEFSTHFMKEHMQWKSSHEEVF